MGAIPSVCVVNKEPKDVAKRLERIGIENKIFSPPDGEESIKAFVKKYRDEQAKRVVDKLRELKPEHGNLMIGWAVGGSKVSFVEKIHEPDPQNGDLLLTLQDNPNEQFTGIQFEELGRKLLEAKRIMVQYQDGPKLPIVQFYSSQLGPQTLRMFTLCPAGKPSDLFKQS